MGKPLNLILCIFFAIICSNNIQAKDPLSLTPSSLYFIENNGQIRDQYLQPRNDIQYSLQTGGLNIYIGNGQLHYQFSHKSTDPLNNYTKTGKTLLAQNLADPERSCNAEPAAFNTYRMDIALVDANTNAKAIALEPQAYYENYYLPGCPASGIQAHTYKMITYKDVYPGIDWVIYTNGGQLEHEFKIGPGADASQIKLKYSGQTSLRIDEDGSIVATTPLGTIKEHAPVYYCADGSRISSKFILHNNILSYDINDVSGALVIDPIVEWGTYYGPDTTSSPFYAITLDDSAYVYLCGMTYSGTANSIATTGGFQYSYNGGSDGYLVKFDSAGRRLWGTYYGGQGGDWGTGVACDHFGNVFLTGVTGSIDSLNIATIGSPQTHYGGGLWDGFLVRFDANGVRKWATYIGGSGADMPASAFVDVLGHVYVSGFTSSGNNIGTPGTFQPSGDGGYETFVAQYDTSGTKNWGSYCGGKKDEFGGVGCSDGTHVYVNGYTSSPTDIATPGTQQTTFGGGTDAYIVKLDVTGNRMWGTYYGGPSTETVGGIYCDDGGDLYLLGCTSSNTGIASPGCFQPFKGSSTDAFVARFDKVTGVRVWGTYYGGNGDENVDLSRVSTTVGGIFITGYTNSTMGLASAGAWQTTYGGGDQDAFLAEFDLSGNELWSTYVGGTGTDDGRATASDHRGMYLCGQTTSTTGIGTPGSFLPTGGGGGTGFYYQGYLLRFYDPTLTLSTGTNVTAEQSFSIYPSPNNGSFTLSGTTGTANGTAQISVTDMAGRQIWQEDVLLNNGTVNKHIMLDNGTPAGTYIVKVVVSGNVQVLKFNKL